MKSLEINALAEGVFKYLKEQSENPLDTIAILGTALLMVFDQGTDGAISIERFAKDFHDGMLASYRAKSDKGPESLQ